MRFLWRECRLAVEPSGAATVAAVLSGVVRFPPSPAGPAVLIVSGGNVDPALLDD
jgi:threonine dehydratase